MKPLRILSILDNFTFSNLQLEEDIELITKKPFFYSKYNKVDFLLVESAWQGNNEQWRHKIASYPEHPKRNINNLRKLIFWCKDHHIPTIFWNKEDPYHYAQFIEAAQLFDYIFTTDSLSIPQYFKDATTSKCSTLPFFIQPKLHFYKKIAPIKRSLFMGTYQKNMHDERTAWQNKIFTVAADYGLDLYNRHDNKPPYQFPNFIGDVNYFPPVNYKKTVDMYKNYQHILNVNTITKSPTMFSRRLIEIMACGRLAISNPSLAIETLFKDMCIQLNDEEHAKILFEQLQFGYTTEQKDMIQYAYDHVHQNYTAKIWLKQILKTCNIDHPYLYN